MTNEQPSEMSQQLRDLVQQNLQQAHAMYGQFMEALGAWSKESSNLMTPEFRLFQQRAIQLAKENAEAGFALANDLSRAEDFQEVLALQNRFTQSQMNSYAS